jgi:hypothetical protein
LPDVTRPRSEWPIRRPVSTQTVQDGVRGVGALRVAMPSHGRKVALLGCGGREPAVQSCLRPASSRPAMRPSTREAVIRRFAPFSSRRAECRERPQLKPTTAIRERGRRCRCGRADGPTRRAGPRGSKVSTPTPRGRRRAPSAEVICLEFRAIGILGRATARPQACSAVRHLARSNSRRAKGHGSARRKSRRSSGLMPERS